MKKKDIFIQDSVTSCGASCIQSIVSFYGGHVPLETIKEDTKTGLNGTNAYMLTKALKKYGFTSYGLKVSYDDLKKMTLPVIAHVLKNGYEHFVVIYEVTRECVLTMDPEVGKKKYDKKYFDSIFDGFVVTAYKTGKVPKYERGKSLSNLFYSILKKHKKSILALITLNFLTITLSIIPSFQLKMLGNGVDRVSLTSLLIVITLCVFLLSLARDRFSENLLLKISRDHSYEFTKHIFSLPIRYINNHRVGEIVKKIEDMSSIENLFLKMILINTLDVFTIIVCTTIMFYISFKLALMYLGIVLFHAIITLLFSKKFYNYEKENISLYQNYSGTLIECLEGLESIKNLNGEGNFLAKIKDALEKFLVDKKRMNIFVSKVKNTKVFVFEVGIIFVNVLGFMSLNEYFTFYDLVTIESIFSIIYSSFDSVLNTFSEVLSGKAIFRSMGEFLDLKVERDGETIKPLSNAIKIDDLAYSYDTLHDVIENFSLDIRKGDKILIEGPSGMGKSTLVKCLAGKFDDYKGKILYDSIDLLDISKKSLRDEVLYVGQNERVFMGTIRENITFGIEDELLLNEVLEFCELSSLVNDKTCGVDSMILEGASNISSGEKARIVLARALYKKPSVLILDETLSTVSIDMEQRIINRLLSFRELTLIYITHRKNYSKNFKKIYFGKEVDHEIRK